MEIMTKDQQIEQLQALLAGTQVSFTAVGIMNIVGELEKLKDKNDAKTNNDNEQGGGAPTGANPKVG